MEEGISYMIFFEYETVNSYVEFQLFNKSLMFQFESDQWG